MEPLLVIQKQSKYDEEEIVGLISCIYELLLELDHIDETNVAWAPPEGHELDLSGIPDDLTIDPRVISLMKRLPVPRRGRGAFPVLNNMNNIDYRHPRVLAESRDIDRWLHPGGLDVYNASPTALMLFDGQNANDPCLVLDVEDSMYHLSRRW